MFNLKKTIFIGGDTPPDRPSRVALDTPQEWTHQKAKRKMCYQKRFAHEVRQVILESYKENPDG